LPIWQSLPGEAQRVRLPDRRRHARGLFGRQARPKTRIVYPDGEDERMLRAAQTSSMKG
jgi:hypothetical protein